ncbi:hypothetical protein [Nocardia araoensis]|uniref:hypothetical protein n=1 Tax=Nocardia araoensis TaxID=228600 RepID=UPI0002ED27B4|nr:hypothetical protein [Nocardia araoensis]
MLTGNSFVLPTSISAPRVYEPETIEPQVDSPTTPPAHAPLGGRVRLGDAYVGAQVTEVETDTVSVTVDTNALTMLTGLLRSEQPAASTVTTMRTDLDTQRGEVRVAFSDPSLGEHDLHLDRHPAPGTAGRAPTPPRNAVDSAVV